jgi:beta-glucosidase
MDLSPFFFPERFLWGAATSAHQVEGHNVHNDWWAWEQAGGVKEPSAAACDHYRRFIEDFDLAKSLHHNAHRFSIEWSRLEPEQGAWNDEALAHYAQVVKALRARGLEPVVTLHHYTNPLWAARAGGWAEARMVDWFARYVGRVAEALGSRVRYWVTINEPMVYAYKHYVEGVGPPGAKDRSRALRVAEHVIRAHAAAYRLLHEAQPSAKVSLAKYLPVFAPCRAAWPPDWAVSALAERAFNTAFLEAVTEGRWAVPGRRACRIPEARGTLDYLGVNFYRRQFMRWGVRPSRCLGEDCPRPHHRRGAADITAMGWDVHPPSFTRTLLRAARLRLPILVTENGAAMTDDGARWQFIHSHLHAMAQAMRQGARLLGYLYWSLLDNFEWEHGFGPRFGLIEVDYRTQARRVRDSARRYGEICRTHHLEGAVG